MDIATKESVTGVSMPAYDEDVAAACGAKGHPLFWAEWLSVDNYIAIFKDLLIHRVFDVAASSGSASAACSVLGIHYEGVTMSSAHASWLENMMDKAI